MFPKGFALVLALLVCAGPMVEAGRVAVRRPKKAPLAQRHETLISNITPTAITISEDNGPKTFQLTKFTEFQVDGQKAALGDLASGMRVSVILEDPVHLRRVLAWRTQ